MGYYDFPHTRNYDQDLGFLIKRYFELTKDFKNTREEFENLKKWVNKQIGEPNLHKLINNKLEEWLKDGTIELLLNKVIGIDTIYVDSLSGSDDEKIAKALESQYRNVIFSKREYEITKSIELVSDKNLIGNNATFNTTFRTFVNKNYQERNKIENVTLDSFNVSSNEYCFYLTGIKNFTIKNCILNSQGVDAIYIGTYNITNNVPNNVKILNNVITDFIRQGISIVSGRNIYIENNTISNSKETIENFSYCIDIEPNLDIDDLGNIYIKNNVLNQNGINFYIKSAITNNKGYLFLNDNTVRNTSFYGFNIARAVKVFSKNNRISKAKGNAFSYLQILESVCDNFDTTSNITFEVSNVNNVFINLFIGYNTNGEAIKITSSDKVIIMNSTVEGTYGIHSRNCSNIEINNNTTVNSTIYPIYCEGLSDNTNNALIINNILFPQKNRVDRLITSDKLNYCICKNNLTDNNIDRIVINASSKVVSDNL